MTIYKADVLIQPWDRQIFNGYSVVFAVSSFVGNSEMEFKPRLKFKPPLKFLKFGHCIYTEVF